MLQFPVSHHATQSLPLCINTLSWDGCGLNEVCTVTEMYREGELGEVR